MLRILLIVTSVLALGLPALAQEWVVSRVRGMAEIQIGLRWVPIERGVVVDPRQTLRTGSDGRVGLIRGSETIELGANTEISLRDGGAELKTSVIQNRGTVSVDVERRNVQHFSVQTPFLAAVVKGTRFTVVVGSTGAEVDVDRGIVQVQDTANDLVTDIRQGQQATVGSDLPLNVSGNGPVAIFTFEGEQVVPGTTEVVEQHQPEVAPDSPRMGPPEHSNAGGLANGRADKGGGNGNGPPAHSNAGGNGSGPPAHSNAGGNGNGPPAHSNAGGNGNGPPAHSNAGGNGNGPPAHSNAGGNGNGPPAHSNAGGNGNGNGPPEHSNAGGNGKGKGRQ